jgi:phosphotransferase system IIA component
MNETNLLLVYIDQVNLSGEVGTVVRKEGNVSDASQVVDVDVSIAKCK